MKQQRWLVYGVLGVLVLLVGVGWLVRDQFAPVEVGSVAPDHAAVDLEGNAVRLSNYDGEVVLLNIWATWCPPCREEMPSMQRLYETAGPKGLRMIAVIIDRPLGGLDASGNRGGDVRAFVEETGLTFDIWLDPGGEVQRSYRATAVPESFLIDRRGNIVKKVIGPTTWDSEANVALIERLLEES